MADIKSVKPLQDYVVEVILNNGSMIMLDMKHKLKSSRFCQLEDVALFNKVTTDGNFVHWTDFIELSAGEVCDIAKSNLGGVEL